MRCSWPIAFVLLLSAGTVRAHPQFALSTVNRYGRLVLLPNKLLFDYSLMVGEVPAEQLQRTADLDRDGNLSAAELKSLAEQLRRTIEKDVGLRLDGKPLPLTWTMQPLQLKRPTTQPNPAPFALELSAEAALLDDRQAHQVVVDDRADLPPVGEVELRIEDSPEVTVLSTTSGNFKGDTNTAPTTAPPPVAMLFRQFGPPRSLLSDRSVTLRYQRRPEPMPPRRSPWSYLFGVTALLALLGGTCATRKLLRH